MTRPVTLTVDDIGGLVSTIAWHAGCQTVPTATGWRALPHPADRGHLYVIEVADTGFVLSCPSLGVAETLPFRASFATWSAIAERFIVTILNQPEARGVSRYVKVNR